MGRHREFDTDELLETAMLAFIEKGFQGTSMRHLEAATGVKQVSIYNAFGDKEGLFVAVLDRYTDILLHAIDGHLEDRGLDGIVSFMDSVVSADATHPHVRHGCLMVNTALIADNAGPAVRKRVQAWRGTLHGRFLAALGRAESRGEVRRGLDLDHCADFVISVLWGIFITICLVGGDQTIGARSAAVLHATMLDWRESAA